MVIVMIMIMSSVIGSCKGPTMASTGLCLDNTVTTPPWVPLPSVKATGKSTVLPLTHPTDTSGYYKLVKIVVIMTF